MGLSLGAPRRVGKSEGTGTSASVSHSSLVYFQIKLDFTYVLLADLCIYFLTLSN